MKKQTLNRKDRFSGFDNETIKMVHLNLLEKGETDAIKYLNKTSKKFAHFDKGGYVWTLSPQLGGVLNPTTQIDPSFEEPRYDGVEYEKIVGTLNSIVINADQSDILVLKLGSNDLQTMSRCDNGRCTYFIEDDSEKGTELITDQTIQLGQKYMHVLGKYAKRLLSNRPAKVTILQIDPMNETHVPFIDYESGEKLSVSGFFRELIKIIENNGIKPDKRSLGGYFPLSRSLVKNSDTSKIIELLTKYRGYLILFNAIGSQCYGIMKTIIDYRKLTEHGILYGGVVNDVSGSNCDTGDQIFTVKNADVSSMNSETFYDNFTKKTGTRADPRNLY